MQEAAIPGTIIEWHDSVAFRASRYQMTASESGQKLNAGLTWRSGRLQEEADWRILVRK
jgi:hypothetical protein